MTTRDRIMLIAVVAVAALGGFWFLVLGPKRDDAKALDGKIASADQRLQAAQQAASQAESAKSAYRKDYAAVARLGAAVPADDNTATLLYQLQSAASGARVDLRTFSVTGGATSSANSTPAQSSSSSSSSDSSSTGTSTSTSASASAAATQAATATLPPGASVGTAGFPTMPFEFTFQGSFAEMQDLLRSIHGFVRVKGDDVAVSGRLLTVNGISLLPTTFPQVKAKIAATAFLLPANQSATPAVQATGTQSSTTSSAIGATTP
jgi:hypothetical protein